MNLSDYILLSREERLAHVDLSSECVMIKRSSWGRKKKEFLNFLGVVNDVYNWRGRIGRCHCCLNHTNSGSLVCVNPKHIYIGDQSENNKDRPPELASKGGKKQAGYSYKQDQARIQRNRPKGMVNVKVCSPVTGETVVFRSIAFTAFALKIKRDTVMRNMKEGTLSQRGWVFTRSHEGD